ncbi:Uncharacterised protein [uncultured archaeon]|nr:Uncharacterised protein [uncultured archaeon]
MLSWHWRAKLSSLKQLAYGCKWRGVIIEESLEDKSLLDIVRIVKTEKATLENEKEAGVLTFHKIEVSDAKKEEFLKRAQKAIKDRYYLHICRNGIAIVVYKNKVFEFSGNETEKITAARNYGISIGILREQLEFEALIDTPWA